MSDQHFPGVSVVKNCLSMQKTLAQSLGQENSPGGGNTLVFLPAKFHIQRSPAGYSPWGCKESDMTGHARAWPKKKKNLVVRCAVTWVGLEIIILSKVSQTEKSKYCMISCICGN